MTVNYKVSVDLGSLAAARSIVSAEIFPLLRQAVGAVAQATQANWMQAVYKAKLWSGEKDAYANSITWKMTSDFTAIVEASYDGASGIETGRPGRDLKKMLDTSPKVRRTKTGKRFLVIPFRHNIPGEDGMAQDMPAAVYGLAKDLTASMVTGQRERRSGEITILSPKTGMTPAAHQTAFALSIRNQGRLKVNQNEYQWGGRLNKGQLKGAGLSAQDQKRYAGLVRFDTSGGSGQKYSNYLTFRVLMEGSTKWVTKAQGGKFIAKSVQEKMQPLAEQAFGEAIKRTLG